MTHEEKVKAITTDFLERDGDKFVKIRKNGRLGWEDTIPAHGAYSSKIISEVKSDIDQYKVAFSIGKDMLKAMNLNKDVKLSVNRVSSLTDGKQICISTKVFDDFTKSFTEKLDVFIGDMVHEASHILFSDFTQFTDNAAINALANIIEDERIERATCERTPGLACFLGQSKYYHFEAEAEEVESDAFEGFSGLMNTVFGLVRYPKSLKPELVDKYADELLQVKQILTPYPTSTEESFKAAHKIYDILMKYQEQPKQEEPEEQEQPEQEGGQSASNEQGSDNEQSESSSSPSFNGSEESDNSSSDENENEGQDEQDEQGQGSESSSNSEEEDDNQEGENKESESEQEGNSEQGSESRENEQETESGEDEDNDNTKSGQQQSSIDPEEQRKQQLQREQIIEQMASASSKTGIQNESDVSQDIKTDRQEMIQRMLEGGTDLSSTGRIVTMFPKPNPTEYEKIRQQVSPYITGVRKALTINSTEFQFAVKGNRSGRLDTNRMVEGIQGVDTIYTRQGEVKSDKVNVVLLIDESGSMDGSNQEAASQAAVLIAEALNGLKNVNLYVYGHSNIRSVNLRDWSVMLDVYIEGDIKASRKTLGRISARGRNIDSEAIREVVKRVRSKTSDDCLFIIITDGIPNEPFSNVREAVKDAQKQGFDVLAVSIEKNFNPQEVYPKGIQMTDLSSFAKNLAKMVKGTVLGKTNRRISF